MSIKKEKMKEKDKKSKKKRGKILSLIIAFALIVFILIEIYLLKEKSIKPEMELIGEEEIILNLGEEYEEKGAKASVKNNEIEVKTEGNIDTSVPGEYIITYIARYEKNGNESSLTRRVKVIDNIAPEIVLNGNESVELVIGKEYKEEGAIAKDNVDGDISDKIQINGTVDTSVAGQYEVEYIVQDTAGNKSSAKRIITVKEKPTAVLKNGLPVLMYHFFYDKTKESPKDNNYMEISDFEAQIKYLTDNDFYFPTWEEVEDYIDGKSTLPEKSVVITVDDGDDSFFDLAVPIIQKYDARATSFVITSWYGWRADNKEKNIDYQSHSSSMHEGANGKGVMLSWPYEKVVDDLKTSSERLGGSTVFCYPFGHYNESSKKALKEAGYKLAFTIEGGRVYKGSDKYALPRVRMSKGVSLNTFKNMVK